MNRYIRKMIVIGAFFVTLAAFAAASYMVSHREARQLSQVLMADDGSVARALFTGDDFRGLLISLIDNERKKISFAIYTMTDKAITEALIRAAKRGVKVEGVVDRSYGHSRYSKVCMLANAKLPIFVYQTSDDEWQAGLMHNKFMVFADTIEHKALVWTGSYNFTKRASEKNEENVIVLDNRSVVTAYENYFERLKKKSLQISGTIQCQSQDEPDESSWLSKFGLIF